jgi:hypothetical protein
MMYLTIAKYGLIAAIGAMLMLFVYATPRIDSLEKQIAQIKADDAQATATLEAAALAKQKEYDNERLEVVAQYMAARQAAEKRAADLAGSVSLLNRAIDAYAKSGSGNAVSQAAAGPGDHDVSYSLASMVERCNGLLQRGQQVGDDAAIQINALEQSLGAPK